MFLGSALGLTPVEAGKVRRRIGRKKGTPELSEVRSGWPSLYTPELISHWTWAAPGRAATLGEVALHS